MGRKLEPLTAEPETIHIRLDAVAGFVAMLVGIGILFAYSVSGTVEVNGLAFVGYGLAGSGAVVYIFRRK
jgi:hypothetical protein